MKVEQEYNPDTEMLAAVYLDGNTTHIGENDWIALCEDGKVFLSYKKAEREYLKVEQERLEYLADINHLLDELYFEIASDKSNHIRLYKEAIERYKGKVQKDHRVIDWEQADIR